MKNMINKKRGEVSGGIVILIVVALVAAYMINLGGVQDLLKPGEEPIVPVGRCPSSGLTEVTLNAQEALASTATDSFVNYYIYDNGMLIKDGETGSDGTVSFDVACGAGKKYTMIVLNETGDVAAGGSYAQTLTVDASGPTDTHNIKTYEYGQIHIANIGSSVDPSEDVYISGGAGKTCGFVITFSNNETASAFNKPLIMCQTNTSSVIDLFMDGVTEADAKKPVRISATSGYAYSVWEYDTLLKSTDAAVKLSGRIQFSTSAAPVGTDVMTCLIVDQSTFQKAEYKTLSLSEGFIEAAENTETRANTGSPDSNSVTLAYNGSYC